MMAVETPLFDLENTQFNFLQKKEKAPGFLTFSNQNRDSWFVGPNKNGRK